VIAGVRGLLRHRELLLGLARRELFAPFAGSAFGSAWALLHPLLQTLLYVLVFTSIFELRFGGGEVPRLDAASYMLAGLIPWMTWSLVLNGACTAVTGSAHLVRQADFPAEVLPLRTVLVALAQQAVMAAVLLASVVLRFGEAHWTWVLLPLVVLLQAVAMAGAAWGLAALCVFVRDAKEVVAFLVTLGIYLVPAFYLPGMVEGFPPALRAVLQLNPFTHYLNVWRDCLFWGEVTAPWSWAVVTLLAPALAVPGYRAFRRLRLFFGNFT
jgi:lipopolysaccharide transport system permease protein